MKEKIRQKKILKSLLDISGFINYVENPGLILSLIIEECVLLTRAEWGAVLSYDKDLNLDAFQITKALTEKEKARLSFILNDRVKEIIQKSGVEVISLEGFWSREDIQKLFKETLGKKVKSILVSPVKKKGLFLGLAILVNKKTKTPFSKKDKENLAIIAQEAAMVIDNINLIKAKLQTERMAAIGQTIAGISHYVKNILQGITTGSYLLNDGIKDEDVAVIKNAWNVVNKNTERISNLVMDMLYYSRERKPAKQKIDPRGLIEDVLELIQSRLKEKKIKLKLSIKELPRSITVNENGIHRALLNLMGNAIEACDKPDSLVKLETAYDKPAGDLRIIISDNGRGISKDDRDRIFQPFYTRGKGKGTGLGLAITKKIIDEHGGFIKVESELSKGTTFEISIPTKI